MDPKDIRLIVSSHTNYWSNEKNTMSKYTDAYKGQMFRKQSNEFNFGDAVILNTSDCYAFVESYIASLFSKAPAVSVGPDATAKGSPEIVQTLVNRFLYDEFTTLENGIRYALLYPCSFFKLGICEKDMAVDSIEIRSVKPWDIIVDMEANKWNSQRFVGHRYYLPLDDAKEKWSAKEWIPAIKDDYLSNWTSSDVSNNMNFNGTLVSTFNTKKKDGSTLLTFVEIIEMYDMINDELIFFSPSIKTSDGILETVSPIPYRTFDDAPLAPIAPLFLSTDPHLPLKGMSSVGRVYDQLFEINNLRTVWANGLRKDARIYMAHKGSIDQEARSQLASNIDNSIVEVNCPPDVSLGNVIIPVPQVTYSPDYAIYKAEVRADLDRGSILAPFTRGVASSSSATEVAALVQYSASEIGKLARARDVCIEQIAKIYISMLHFLLDTSDDGSPELIYIEGKPTPLVPSDFLGKFTYAASDQSASPVSAALRKQQFTESIPVLLSLGVDKAKILELFLKEMGLPMDLAKAGASTGAQMTPVGKQMGPADVAIPVGGGAAAAAIRSGE